jgi:RsiW-degrading membrane proteinase PrsW (M82 family)
VTQLDTHPTAAAPAGPSHGTRRHIPQWLLIFGTGLLLWVATVVVTFTTQNTNLIPAVILIGSFLVPVTFASYALTRADAILTTQRIFVAFVCGGLLGVLGASVLEAAFIRGSAGWTWLWVGAIEEAVKLAALWLMARRLPRRTVRDGIVLGAAVGLGFAAFESAGYAFDALFTSNSLSLLNLVETEGLRAVLSPFGHGTWTALVGGALFAVLGTHGAVRRRRAISLLGVYLVVVLLHAFWDAASGIAVWLTLLLTGGPTQLMTPLGEVAAVTQQQVHIYTVLSWALMLLDGLVGLLLLWLRWRAAIRVPVPPSLPAMAAQPAASAAA